MEHLIAGYRRYRGERWPRLRELHEKLAQGQTPRVLVIACCDSRVDPATIFDADPGELFVIRNVANLAPPFEQGGGYHGTSAAIEFAVTGLKVSEILVLGHAQCGGVAAALNAPAQPTTFVDHWVGLLDPAKERIAHVHDDRQTALEYESVKVTMENLRTFPFVAERVAAGDLRVYGARYGVADGGLELYDPAKDAFTPVS
ncbi:MAG: carbonic anhydrase [Hyphomonadaceae bacterium]|nr:carbonic anhydrase [Hyphomonadaceae bacterium]